jgi:hypothetical protein
MHQGRHVHQLDRAGGPDRSVARVPAGAEQDQHRAQPLAAGAKGRDGILGQDVASAPDELVEPLLYEAKLTG